MSFFLYQATFISGRWGSMGASRPPHSNANQGWGINTVISCLSSQYTVIARSLSIASKPKLPKRLALCFDVTNANEFHCLRNLMVMAKKRMTTTTRYKTRKRKEQGSRTKIAEDQFDYYYCKRTMHYICLMAQL